MAEKLMKKPKEQSAKPAQQKTQEETDEEAKAQNTAYGNLYAVWRVLQEYSSEENPMTASQVFERLKSFENAPSQTTVGKLLKTERWLMGELFYGTVEDMMKREPGMSGRTAKATLESLAENPDLVINTKLGKGKNSAYLPYEEDLEGEAQNVSGDMKGNFKQKSRIHYYYLRPPFQGGEWQLFADLVRNSPMISPQATQKLLEQTKKLAGVRVTADGEDYMSKRWDEGDRVTGVIDTLRRAIACRYKIDVVYGQYQLVTNSGRLIPKLEARSEKPWRVKPYALVWSNGYYYLVGQMGDEGTIHYRVDRILSVEETEESFRLPERYSVTRERNHSPVMGFDEPVGVTLRCEPWVLNNVIDFFGNLPLYEMDKNEPGKILVKLPAVSAFGVKQFALQYLNGVEILKPQSLRDSIRQMLDQGTKTY